MLIFKEKLNSANRRTLGHYHLFNMDGDYIASYNDIQAAFARAERIGAFVYNRNGQREVNDDRV